MNLRRNRSWKRSAAASSEASPAEARGENGRRQTNSGANPRFALAADRGENKDIHTFWTVASVLGVESWGEWRRKGPTLTVLGPRKQRRDVRKTPRRPMRVVQARTLPFVMEESAHDMRR